MGQAASSSPYPPRRACGSRHRVASHGRDDCVQCRGAPLPAPAGRSPSVAILVPTPPPRRSTSRGTARLGFTAGDVAGPERPSAGGVPLGNFRRSRAQAGVTSRHARRGRAARGEATACRETATRTAYASWRRLPCCCNSAATTRRDAIAIRQRVLRGNDHPSRRREPRGRTCRPAICGGRYGRRSSAYVQREEIRKMFVLARRRLAAADAP